LSGARTELLATGLLWKGQEIVKSSQAVELALPNPVPLIAAGADVPR